MIKHIERTWSARVLRGDSLVLGEGREHIQGWTPLGIRKRKNARCNGVLIHVDDEELARFDIREEGYTRHRIDLVHVYRYCDKLTDSVEDSLDDVQCPECRHVFEMAHKKRSAADHAKEEVVDIDSDIAVWVYIQNEIQHPNPSYPFTQSYLDVIMRGCFSVSKEFARMFLQTTTGWSHDGKSDNPNKDNNDESNHEPTHHTWVDDRHSPMYARADSEFSLEHASIIDQLIEEHHPHAIKKWVVSM